MEDGVFEANLPEDLAECWLQINKCRIYTEKILFLDEILIPAMGEVYTAKAMFDSLTAWKQVFRGFLDPRLRGGDVKSTTLTPAAPPTPRLEAVPV